MPTINVGQLIDKTAFASSDMYVRRLPSVTGQIFAKLKKGDRVGKIYSWVGGRDKDNKKDGTVWLMLYDSDAKRFGAKVEKGEGAYFRSDLGTLDWKAFQEQGAKTVEEEIKEKENKDKDWTDKLLEAGKWILLAWVGTSALKTTGKKK